MSTLTDRFRAFDPGSRRFAPRDASGSRAPEATESLAPQASSASRELDAETLDVVEKFEAAFTELVPTAPAPTSQDDPARAARLDIGLLDEELRKAFEDDEPFSPPQSRSVVHSAFDPVLQAAARPALREAKDQNLSFEDAMATLRASEARGRPATGGGEYAESHGPSSHDARQPQASPPREISSQVRSDALPVEPLSINESWAARSRKVWPRVAGAAALALFVGTAAGYLAGKTPTSGTSRASIGTTPQGGAQLRFDYNLSTR